MTDENDTAADGLDEEAFDNWFNEQQKSLQKYLQKNEILGEDASGEWLWIIPYKLMLGRLWSKAAPDTKIWVVTGEVPIDHAAAQAATSPREAAKYFAMRWHMAAARIAHAAGDAMIPEGELDWRGMGSMVEQKAEWIYELADDPQNWQPDGTPVRRIDIMNPRKLH